MSLFNVFALSVLVAIAAFLCAFFALGGLSALAICALLAALEICLSFDNAVINAKVLATMSPIWQRRFLIWGIFIAVFVVRALAPVLIVYLTTPLSWSSVFHEALSNPQRYADALEHGYPLIGAFGGAFLLLVFLSFLINGNREVIWLKPIEVYSGLRGRHALWLYALMLVILAVMQLFFHSVPMAIAFLVGMGLHGVLHWVMSWPRPNLTAASAFKAGLIGFLYLEVLDASFSIDGVVAAFALTQNIFIILLGLGVGAFFVRSITIYLLQRGTLGSVRYLEHGAHYAIGSLGALMLLKIYMHVPEWLVAGIGLVWLVASVLASLYEKRA